MKLFVQNRAPDLGHETSVLRVLRVNSAAQKQTCQALHAHKAPPRPHPILPSPTNQANINLQAVKPPPLPEKKCQRAGSTETADTRGGNRRPQAKHQTHQPIKKELGATRAN